MQRSYSIVPGLPTFFEILQDPDGLPAFDKVQNPLHQPHERTSERPKVVRDCQFLTLLIWK